MIAARFDDLLAARSFQLVDPVAEYVAVDLDDVSGALRAAEDAARAGRWVAAMLAYEAAPAFDPALTVRPPEPGFPLAWFGVFSRNEPVPVPTAPAPAPVSWRPSLTPAAHRVAVARIRDLIADGVTYQVNFTHRLLGTLDGDVDRLYAAMLHAQRPAHGALLRFGDWAVVSASPELFLSAEGDRLVTRPMKGTARRGRWSAEDRRRAADLRASPKDRAENLMIVDLLRNDLGRVADFGSVKVESLCELEPFETVWQLTSTISARRRPGLGLAELVAALFPCGSVTGAPKHSTMRVIADLETSPRGPYCGALGFIEPGSDRAVLAVGIRTALVDIRRRSVVFGTGGGITWDSDPADEWRETEAKAALLTVARPGFDLLETLRIDAAGYHQLDRHLDRMAASAEYFRRPFDRSRIGEALSEVIPGEPPRRVRLTVDATGAPTVDVTPIGETPEPVRLAVDGIPIDRFDVFRYHKTTHRRVYDAAVARHPEADDVVAVNDRGEAVETTIGNLVVGFGDRWVTPPLDAGCLPGVERERMLAAGQVVEEPIAVDDLAAADEIQVVNSVRLRRRAVLLQGPPRSRHRSP